MSDIKAWVFRLFGFGAIAALFAPWHLHDLSAMLKRPQVSVAVPAPIVPEPQTKIQDRLETVWPKIEGPAPFVMPTDIRPTLSADAAPAQAEEIAPSPGNIGHSVQAKKKITFRPARHRAQRRALGSVERDGSWLAQFFMAAAKRAGAIP